MLARQFGTACAASVVALATTAFAGTFPGGSYISGPYTLEFGRDGAFRVSAKGSALVVGTYLVHGNQLVLTDKTGPFACEGKGQATGTYGWRIEAEMLKLEKVEDNCNDRVKSFANPWKKK